MSRANAFLITPLLLIAVLVLMPYDARALGLGEARVDSFLNQALDVRVRLLEADELELESLTVRPASPDDFSRLGLTSSSLALDIGITIDRGQVPPVLRIRSSRPVSDPVVQLLLDARWAGGRMLREYTLFLDPPTVAVAPPARAIEPVAEAARPATEPPEPRQSTDPGRQRSRESTGRSEPSPQAGQDRNDTVRMQAGNASGSRYGPVESGETLWSIARQALPAEDISMNQMMVAIVELNPNAFRNGNINQLLRGARLDLPDAERVRVIDRSRAAETVAAQNRAFNQRVTGDVPVISDDARNTAGNRDATDPEPTDTADTAGTAPAATDASNPEVPESTVDHRLALVPPTEAQGGAGSAAAGVDIESLRQRLARAEEELYAARQEAEAFEQRVDQLETLVRNDPQGSGIRDADLAGLEEALRAARAAIREDADPALRADASARLDDYLEQFSMAGSPNGTEATAESGRESRAGAQDQSLATEQSEAAQAADPEPVQPVVTRVGDGTQGWFDRLLTQPLLLVLVSAVLLLIALAGLWVALRRGRREALTAPAPAPAAARPRESGSPVKSRSPAESTPPGPSTAAGPAAAAPSTPAAVPVSLESARERVVNDPSDLSAHLMCIRALAARGDEDQLAAALEDMFESLRSGDEPEWREALEIAGPILPSHGLIKGSSDWTSDAGPLSGERAGERTEIDDDSEVDDLMSRLDEDLENEESDEPDDSDWLDELEGDSVRDDSGPLLRDADVDNDVSYTPPAESLDESRMAEGPLDFDEWLDEDEPDPSSSDLIDGDSIKAGEDVEDELVLDWPEPGLDDEQPSKAGSESVSDESEGSTRSDDEDEIFVAGDDDVDVKLDLARAYLSWNSIDSARTLLEEIVREGNEAQREQAQKLLDDL